MIGKALLIAEKTVGYSARTSTIDGTQTSKGPAAPKSPRKRTEAAWPVLAPGHPVTPGRSDRGPRRSLPAKASDAGHEGIRYTGLGTQRFQGVAGTTSRSSAYVHGLAPARGHRPIAGH